IEHKALVPLALTPYRTSLPSEHLEHNDKTRGCCRVRYPDFVSQSTTALTPFSAGVIGLSSAILLQEAGYAVTIVARDFPGPFETMDPNTKINYTSPWGGARMYRLQYPMGHTNAS